ncbi:DUF300-domain-containing protein [Roridomyces roridus]|uniref:DUF300-domain-containing protein n=1 Tax=Roridomyces roridus TaxID=1738132 RepID=A0AAD7C8K4_9AGAR|nr:DUF300-domain-containing protein [Roridomyces roridus]
MPTCPSDNAAEIDQSNFWNPNGGIDWDQHRIGWAIAGGCALLTVILTCFSVLQHCRNYNVPREQRQIIRILYMPPVYAVISFFSYRYFRSYTYYSLIYVAYEAITISAFLMLIIEYVSATAHDHSTDNALARKDKRPLPIPFCCWRYRPTKAYFMYTVKWSVMQYVIVRPAISIAGIICQAFDVLCESQAWNLQFASVYLSIIDFISISIALYGLLIFFGLMRDELKGRRPLAKFLVIKLIVMATFYQSFVFSMLEGWVIHGTKFWTETNIADGLNALAICIEMVFFAIAMWWAYTPAEYRVPGKSTSIWRPLWDSINYMDFAMEIYGSLRYYFLGITHPNHHRSGEGRKLDFGQAFGVTGAPAGSKLLPRQRGQGDEFVGGGRFAGGEDIGMSAYHAGSPSASPYAFTAPGASASNVSLGYGHGGYGDVSPGPSPQTVGFEPAHEPRLP